DGVVGHRSRQPGAADRPGDRPVVLRLRAPCGRCARTLVAPGALLAARSGQNVSIWQRVVAVILALAAVVVVVVAVADDPSQSGAASRAAATPVWSVRRVPQPIVDAVGAQRLQKVLDDDYGGDGTCFLVMGSGAQLAAHNVDTPLIGASTQKILLAAAALTAPGP